MNPVAIQNLRSLVHDCLAKHMYDAAIFFADKLVTLSGYSPAEVYTLAQAFFVDRQYHRCLQLLRGADFTDKDIRFRYLAARCLAESKEWEECLELLGGMDIDTPEQLTLACPSSTIGTSLDYISAVCLLRGQVFDSLENFPRAVAWYKAALRTDPFNHEAFDRLIGRHKLSQEEEVSVIEDIVARLPEEQRWLGLLYRSKSRQLDCHDVGRDGTGGEGPSMAERALRALENEPPNPQPQHGVSGTKVDPGYGDDVASGFPQPGGETTPSVISTKSKSGMKTRRGSAITAMTISPIQEESGSDTPSTASMTPVSIDPGASLGAAGEGWGLAENADVAACRAELLFRKSKYQEAYAVTSSVLERDPFAEVVMPVHLAAAVQLRKKNELFLLGHKLIKAHPERPVSWYTAGCYYYATGQFLSARQYFGKSTLIDRTFAPAWIAFALAFAAQDETDQAMAAFRTAGRLFPGLHEPLLGMGLEYSRMNNLSLAEQMLIAAHQRCPGDTLIAHEMGTLAYRCGRYADAVKWLTRAVAPCGGTLSNVNTNTREVTWVNLGHALRKLRRWEEAIEAFTRALGLAPHHHGTQAALGYTLHLAGDRESAIEYYHKALGLRSEDAFVATMLGIALEEESERALVELEKSLPGLDRLDHLDLQNR